jgi:hypothetical protein
MREGQCPFCEGCRFEAKEIRLSLGGQGQPRRDEHWERVVDMVTQEKKVHGKRVKVFRLCSAEGHFLVLGCPVG